MSYGLFNWWWGEDTEDSDWSWLIAHVSEIVQDVKSNQNTRFRTLLMQHHTETEEFNLGWLDFRFLPLQGANYTVDTAAGIATIANWMELNITIPLQNDGTYGDVSAGTITSFIKILKTHRPFYEENILKGEPFVWIPKLPWQASHLWYEPDWDNQNRKAAELRKIDHLMVDIGEGYICINPEANRIITHLLSDIHTNVFEEVADTADWNYPQWYLEGSPPYPLAR
jgi:hypothetical protein